MKYSMLVLVLLAAITSCNSSSRKVEQQLIELNKKYDQAVVQNNFPVLDSLYADDFIYTAPEGDVRTKQQQLSLLKAGDLKLDSAKSHDVRVKVYNDAAVITGLFAATGYFRNNPVNIRERYTSVWVKKNDRWQLVAEQGNFLKTLGQ